MDSAVDLEHGKCDCGVYAVEKIPCSHAIAAGTSDGLHISTLVCLVYSKDFLFAGYSENRYPCVGQQVEERTCFPPDVKRGPRRQKKSRWQSWLELSRMRGRKPRKQHMGLILGALFLQPSFLVRFEETDSLKDALGNEILKLKIADTMTVQPIDGWRFFVKGGKMDCVVDLEHGKCDCGVYAVEKIPCSHAIAAGTSAGLHISTLVCPVYSKDFLFAGYSENIYPCVGQQVEERTCFPPDVKRGPGRQKK
ncbi:hypothetical protein F2Q68_00027017 [Brassica cretica]|uniref:SWIM-type domain-containing protein n=1 Tax=Brassica cretica TaxID=69181 RepID=A0A8S9I7I1_BRACR|nr:hypothetical protein F2Q68_00027017 [Brassica cretica]